MYCTKVKFSFFAIAFILCLPHLLHAQSPLLRWEPEFSYTWSPYDRWSFNTKVGGRNTWIVRQDNEINQTNYDWRHLEAHFFATYALFGGNRLGAGYQYRWESPFFEDHSGYEHRLMQQYAFVTFTGALRITHRIRAEQQISDDGFDNRFRYRFSYDFPLNGQQLDPGETYLILSDEVLWSVNAYDNELDNRIYVGIGWFFSDQRKLEIGLQYRLEAINKESAESIFHFNTAYYLNQ